MNTLPKKTILSMRVARDLLALGFKIIDIEYSKKTPGKPAFVFHNNEALEDFLTKAERG